jgi:prepilin-type N-terminal cleavage/methylation domain-containing protein
MVKSRSRSTAGFTLTEVLIVVAIIGFVVMAGPTLLIQMSRFYYLHNARVEIQRDARASLDNINRFLRQATASSTTIDQVTGQPPYSRISFTTVGGQTMQFYQSGAKLYQVAQSTTLLSNNLRYIAFTYPRTDDPTILSVAITMEKATYEGGSKALELSIEKVRIMN